MPNTPVDPYYHSIALLHGLTGLVIFISGLLQFLLNKGGKAHRIIGRVYLFAWIPIILTGMYIGDMAIVDIVGLGFYLALTGVRIAILKNKPFNIVDKLICVLALLVVISLMVYAVIYYSKGFMVPCILSAVFALLYTWVVGNDALQIFRGKRLFFKPKFGKMDWYMGHLTKMNASYITAVAAFCAVQNVFHNTLLNFFLPSIAGIILMNISRRYFIKKLNLVEEKMT